MAGVHELVGKNEVTGHCWQDNSDYIVCCTSHGLIIVSSLIQSEVT